jgi:rhodanese-related sulfurtransferase
MRTITREELKAKLDAGDDFTLIDVLDPESYRHQHLPRAINVPLMEIEAARVASLPEGRETIVYCASFACTASPLAAEKLEALGFTDVVDFEGGLQDWMEADYPVVRGQTAA